MNVQILETRVNQIYFIKKGAVPNFPKICLYAISPKYGTNGLMCYQINVLLDPT